MEPPNRWLDFGSEYDLNETIFNDKWRPDRDLNPGRSLDRAA